MTPDNDPGFFLHHFFIILTPIPDIDPGFFLRHLFKTDSELTRTLQGHYLHSILGQLYKIVG